MTWFPPNSIDINNVNTFSFFDKNIYFNSSSLINDTNINNTFLKTIKVKLNLNNLHIDILYEWFYKVIDIYNFINNYIKSYICTPIPFLDKNNVIQIKYKFINDINKIKEVFRWQNLRDKFFNEITNIKSNSKIYKHTLDYSIKLCVEMYKSAYSNINANNIKSFNVKDLKKDRRRLNLCLEPLNIDNKNKNGIFIKSIRNLGIINCNKILNKLNINHNVILQYDTYNKKYYLLVPIDEKINKRLFREEKCGIDIGVRTFQTIYSYNKCYEIGKNVSKHIDAINKKLDNIKSKLDNDKMKEKIYKKTRKKYQLKLENKISDLHKKTCNFLLRNYEIINIGKVSIKSMISKLKGNLKENTKRRLIAMKHYKFREYLKLNACKYNTIINEVDE